MIRRIRRVLSMLSRRADRRWLESPAGCCTCGTGGPYYHGDAEPVTRYLYSEATPYCVAKGDIDWTACSAHALRDVEPLHDYGRDVVVTSAQAYDDATAVTR